jgi:hypothetical protein
MSVSFRGAVMTHVSELVAISVIGSLAVLTGAAGHASQGVAPADVLAARPLQIVYEGGVVDGSCALVYMDSRVEDVMLYFVTSARLFKTPDGQPLPDARAIRVTLDGGNQVTVGRQDVFLPIGNLVDVAVLRAEAPYAAVLPGTMSFDAPPPAGSDFLIAGYDDGGALATVAEHVRFLSTRLVVGDRDVSGLAGCLGAPAISADGIFGVVSECDAGRAPVVTLLALASPFLARHVPGLMVRPTLRER